MSIRALFAILATLVVSCAGPTICFPGGALEGSSSAPPADWGFFEETSTVQLETNPADPYSVNIWAVGMGDRVYVHAGANRSQWVENMETDPAVRIRIEETIYDLTAARVTDQAEFDAFADVYEKKYGNRPRNESVQEAYLFRLTPR